MSFYFWIGRDAEYYPEANNHAISELRRTLALELGYEPTEPMTIYPKVEADGFITVHPQLNSTR